MDHPVETLDINVKGTTVLVATHDWDTVKKMQRRIITMERGRITDGGGTGEPDPHQRFSAKPGEGVNGSRPNEAEP